MGNMGLVEAARNIESYGRGPDKQLAHIAPDEAQFLDYLQGGRRENPHTGLPEYSLFGKILKAVARVAGAVGGFMIGGPAGAALGSAAATKLTGGSWKDSLKAGALSGLGGYAAQGLSGGGWSAIGNNSVLAGGSQAAAAADIASQVPSTGLSAGSTQGLAMLGDEAPSGIGSAIGSGVSAVGGYPAVAAGLGALQTPLSSAGMPQDPGSSAPPPGFGGSINLNVAPLQRAYQPYPGDPSKFGEVGGGWKFFDEINPAPKYLAHGGAVRGPVRGYALGGGVMNPRGPGAGISGLGSLRQLGIPSQIQAPHFDDPQALRAQAQDLSPEAQRENIRRAAMLGYINAKDGGSIHGPGSGTSDSVDAKLSNDEFVMDAGTTAMLGEGSSEEGHKRWDEIRHEIRRRAGMKNPKKPMGKVGNARALVSKVM